MEKLNSYQISPWPFEGYEFISDLIEYEGPLLIHYRSADKHALFYWVDNDKVNNRWLCFHVTLIELYDYLNQNYSLRELIVNKIREPFYTIDIDADFNYSNPQMLLGYFIPDEYLPDVESFYTDDVSTYYETLFNELDKDAKYY